MSSKFMNPVRLIEQCVSVLALGLFAATLIGVRQFSAESAEMGLALAIGAGTACLFIVGAMIYLHYPSPKQKQPNGSESSAC